MSFALLAAFQLLFLDDPKVVQPIWSVKESTPTEQLFRGSRKLQGTRIGDLFFSEDGNNLCLDDFANGIRVVPISEKLPMLERQFSGQAKQVAALSKDRIAVLRSTQRLLYFSSKEAAGVLIDESVIGPIVPLNNGTQIAYIDWKADQKDQRLVVKDVDSRQTLFAIALPEVLKVKQISFSPDRKVAALVTHDEKIFRVKLSANECKRIALIQSQVLQIACANSGKITVLRRDGAGVAASAYGEKPISEPLYARQFARRIGTSLNGAFALLVLEGAAKESPETMTMAVFDLLKGKESGIIKIDCHVNVSGGCISEDGKKVFVCKYGVLMGIWSIEDHNAKLLTSFSIERNHVAAYPRNMKFEPTRDQLAICLNDLIVIRDGKTGKRRAVLAAGIRPPACAWSTDGTMLAGSNYIWRTDNWTTLALGSLSWFTRDIAFDAEKQRWYYGLIKSDTYNISGEFPDVLTMFPNEEIEQAWKGKTAESRAFHKLAPRWIGDFDSQTHDIGLIEISSNSRILALGLDPSPNDNITLDGKPLVMPCFRSVELRHLDSGKVLGKFNPREDQLVDLAIDGSDVAYSICRKGIYRWKDGNWTKLAVRYLPPSAEFVSGKCLDSGKLLAILSSTGDLAVVDSTSGELRYRLAHDGGNLQAIATQLTGRRIFAAAGNGDTFEWRLP